MIRTIHSDAATCNRDRRQVLQALAAGALMCSRNSWAAASLISPHYRIISDNDYSGDPDGLFQLAHHLLSPSTEVRLIIGSHRRPGETWGGEGPQAASAAAKVEELLRVMGLAGRVPVLGGAEAAIADTRSVSRTVAAEAIITEAMREAESRPLFYVAGAGLTDLATAWLLEPRIDRRMKLVWIGGPEYPGIQPPPPPRETEYNLAIDLKAAQVIFNRSAFDIWQVPRDAYRRMLYGYQELVARVRPTGPLGDYLVSNVERVMREIAAMPASLGIRPADTYVLGDSPLVTLTALLSPFQPDASSSSYVLRSRPTITDQGEYGRPSRGPAIRVYSQVDARLTFEDLIAKLGAFATKS